MAAASTTAAVAATSTAAAAAAAAAFRLGPCFVDRQRTPLDLRAVQRGDRRLCFCVTAHLHKAESLGPACVAVDDHLDGLHRAVLLEQLLQRTVGDAVGKVSHVQLLAHEGLPKKYDERGLQQPCGSANAAPPMGEE